MSEGAQQMCGLIRHTFNPDNETRKAAEAELKKAEAVPGFLGVMFEIAQAKELEHDVRHLAAIRMKQILATDDWNANTKIQAAEKAAIKNNIIPVACSAPNKLRTQLLLVIRSILLVEFPNNWPEFKGQCLNEINVQVGSANPNLHQTAGALSVLRTLAKRCEWKERGARPPFWDVFETGMPALTAIMESISSIPEHTEEHAFLLKLLFKIYFSMTQSAPPFLLANKDLFDKWWNGICAAITRVPPDSEDDFQSPHWKVKKWAYHILGRFVVVYSGQSSRAQEGAEAMVQHFFANHVGRLMEGSKGLLERRRAGKFVSPQVLTVLMNFMVAMQDYPEPFRAMLGKDAFESFLADHLIPIMSFSDEDQEVWEDDGVEFVRRQLDFMSNLYDPKQAAGEFVRQALRKNRKDFMEDKEGEAPMYSRQAILGRIAQVIYKMFSQYNEKAAAAAGKPVDEAMSRLKEGTLFLVGTMAPIFKTTEPFSGQIENLLLTFALPEYANATYPFLRARAVWVTARFGNLEWKDKGGLEKVFLGTCKLMQDEESPVKMTAGASVRNFLRGGLGIEHLVEQHLSLIVTTLFSLIQEMNDADGVIKTIRRLITRHGAKMVDGATNMLKVLCEHALQTMPEVNTSLSWEEFEATGGNSGETELKTNAVIVCLKAIHALITSMKGKPDVLLAFAPGVAGILGHLIQDTRVEFLDEAMELATVYTYYAPVIPDELWAIFPLLYKAASGYAQDLIQTMLPVFDNFVTRATERFVKGSCELDGVTERYLNLFVKMNTAVLDNMDHDSEHSICPKLMTALLEHTKQFQAEVDPYVPALFDAILKSVNTTTRQITPAYQILCFGVIGDGLFYNARLTLDYLNDRNCLQQVMSGMLETVSLMKRRYDRKLALMGVAAIFDLMSKMGDEFAQKYPILAQPQIVKKLCDVGFSLSILLTDQLKDRIKDAKKRISQIEKGEDDDEEDSDTDEDGDWEDDQDEWGEEGEELEDTDSDEEGYTQEDFEKLLKMAKAEGNLIDEIDDENLEDDEYISVIDMIEEVILFKDALSSNQAVCASAQQGLTTKKKADFENALKVSQEHHNAMVEMKKKEEEMKQKENEQGRQRSGYQA